MKKNCIVAQSGGPTAAINASLAGVIRGVMECDSYNKIYGAIHGIQGVLRNNFMDLSDSTDEFINRLMITPAMYLGSCRFKLPEPTQGSDKYEQIFSCFERLNAGAFFYIGGNDSMDTVAKLSAYAKQTGSDIKIAGIPKTIDNDLVMTDHTPGFGSAAKYIASSIREIAYDTYIYDVNSVTIVEIMGRDAGWLTAASALARSSSSYAPQLIYLPETNFDTEQFLADIENAFCSHRNVMAAVSEGIHDSSGRYIAAGTAAEDKFGHAQLSGAGKVLEYLVKDRLNVKVRSVEVNVLQRCAGHLTSKTDLDEAFRLGVKAVEFTKEGLTGFMTTLTRLSDTPYICNIDHHPVCDIANKAKGVPDEWITASGNDVTDELIRYLSPLIEGEVHTDFSKGVVDYLPVNHLNGHRNAEN